MGIICRTRCGGGGRRRWRRKKSDRDLLLHVTWLCLSLYRLEGKTNLVFVQVCGSIVAWFASPIWHKHVVKISSENSTSPRYYQAHMPHRLWVFLLSLSSSLYILRGWGLGAISLYVWHDYNKKPGPRVPQVGQITTGSKKITFSRGPWQIRQGIEK